MAVQVILAHTPIWVWVLLVYLVIRGLAAMKPRDVSVPRMLMVPVLFLAWGLYGIVTQLHHLSYAFAAFVAAFVVGLGIGWLLAKGREPSRRDPATGLIHRPGSPVMLVLILVAFCSKFALLAALGYQPELATDLGYNSLYGGVAGVVSGVFWGGSLLVLRQAFATGAPARI